MSAAGSRERLRAARRIWRMRPEHPTFRDHAYLVYVTLLVTALVAMPLVRGVALTLAQPTALALLSSPGAAATMGVCGAAVWIGALVLGRRRGPVVPPPFVAQTLGDSTIAPSVAWRGRALRALFVAVIVLTAVAALAASGFLAAAPTASGMLFIAGAALFAIPAAVLWLAGQALPGRSTTVVGAALVAWALIGLAAGTVITPWGMLAELWADAGAATQFAVITDAAPSVAVLTDSPTAQIPVVGAAASPLLVLGAFAVVAAACVPSLVSRLRPHVVLTHARRWEAMTLLARTGDLSGAAGRLRPPPAVGRRWRMPLTAPLWWATVQRDAVAAARNPARLLAALIALAAAGALWGGMPQLPASLTWVAGLPAALLCFAGLGPLCDGVREAADSAGRPALFRPSAGQLMLLHAILPALTVVLVTAVSAAIAGGPWLAAAGVGVFVLAVRMMDAAKPPLPLELLMPVPTPAGDASGMFVLLWQADAVLLTAAAGIWLAPTLAAGPAGALWLLASLLVVAAITAFRVRRASR